MSETLQQADARYQKALHGMQTGVAYTMEHDPDERDLKHLRVGVNSSLVSTSALANLLIGKGILDRLEWMIALADAAEAERDRYAEALRQRYPGVEITLL